MHIPLESLEFHEWMRTIDLLCIERFSVSIHDLPLTQSFELIYASGTSPDEFMAEEESDLEAMLP